MNTLSTDEIERARAIDLIALIGEDTILKRIATHEYAGPCPFCGGRDRLHIQPIIQRWFCRQCTGEPADHGWQDAIDYVRRRRNLDFRGAVAWLTGNGESKAHPVLVMRAPAIQTATWRRASWQAETQDLVRKAQIQLAGDSGQVGRHYLRQRGLHSTTWEAWGLGFGHPYHLRRQQTCPAILMPWRSGDMICAIQYRFIAEDLKKDERFSQRSGGERLLFGLDLLADRDVLILVEGELNALSIWQVARSWVDVLSWGPQANLLRRSVAKRAIEVAEGYQHLVLWADELQMAQRSLEVLLESGLFVPQVSLVSMHNQDDANDMLLKGELELFMQVL